MNALWYNAVCYALELAGKHADKAFVKAWESLPARTQASFVELFRLPEGYLADFVGTDGPDKSTRPNMIVACGLNYKMLDEELQLEVIRTVRQHLLTPKGLRTLSPRNLLYKGSLEGGSPAERDFAGKNGSAWPWLLQFYVKACFDIDRDVFLPQAREILANFDEDIQSYGIGSICELYDARPRPMHRAGATSQAWSVGAVLNIHSMICERTQEEARESKTAKAAKSTARKTAAKTAVAKEAAEKKPAAKKSAEKKPTGKKPAETKAATKKIKAGK